MKKRKYERKSTTKIHISAVLPSTQVGRRGDNQWRWSWSKGQIIDFPSFQNFFIFHFLEFPRLSFATPWRWNIRSYWLSQTFKQNFHSIFFLLISLAFAKCCLHNSLTLPMNSRNVQTASNPDFVIKETARITIDEVHRFKHFEKKGWGHF